MKNGRLNEYSVHCKVFRGPIISDYTCPRLLLLAECPCTAEPLCSPIGGKPCVPPAGATLAVILKVALDPAVVFSALIAILYTWIGMSPHTRIYVFVWRKMEKIFLKNCIIELPWKNSK